MRTISLRQFRDSIGDWTEPIAVQRRNSDGSYELLGEWRPNWTPPPSAAEIVGTKTALQIAQMNRDAILRRANKR